MSAAPGDRAGQGARPGLGCVAVPLLARDIGAPLERLFALWTDDRFLPRLTPAAPRPALLIMVNHATPADLARAEALYAAAPRLAACFSGLHVQSADLSADRDLYTRRHGQDGGAYGTRAGPNFLFHATMEAAGRLCGPGDFCLQIELDCLPVGPGWLERVQEVIDAHPRAWVIGSHFAGTGELGQDIQLHLNGNALYRAGAAAFRRFLGQVWMPRLMRHAAERKDLAYDCWWALERSLARAWDGNDGWALVQTYDSFFQADPFIVNLMVPVAEASDYLTVFDRFAALGRTPVFFHGQAMTAVTGALLEHPGDDLFASIDRLSPPDGAAPPRSVAQCVPLSAPLSAPPSAPDPAATAAPAPPAEVPPPAEAPDPDAARRFLAVAAARLLTEPALCAQCAPEAAWGRALLAAVDRLAPGEARRQHLLDVLAACAPEAANRPEWRQRGARIPPQG